MYPYLGQELAKRVITNPKIIGPLLISTVGAQKAEEIQDLFSSGKIPIDDIYNILTGANLTSILNKITSTPSGIESSPDQDDIDRQAEYNRKLGKQTTFADDIKSDPLITPVPEKLSGLLSTPEEKRIDFSNVTPMPAPPKVSDFIQKSEEDTRGEGKQYHGAKQDIQSLVDGYYNNKNFYGNGFYTTDALNVAKGYKGALKGSLYEVVDKKENKLFNLENKITKKNIEDFENYLGPSLLESINFDLNNFKGQTWKESYDEIRDELISEDFTADAVTDELDIINEFFAKDGYDGITYKGGKLTGTEPHSVKQYFNPQESIEVRKKEDAAPTAKGSEEIFTDVTIEGITDFIGGIDFPEEKTDNNLRLHKDRLKKLKDGKIDTYPGGPQNERIVLTAPGTNFPPIAIGKIEFDDWKNRVDSTMSKEQILKAADWYKKIFDEFDDIGAGDKAERDKLATAWLAGQQNETPTAALTNTVFIYEQLQQGVPYDEIKGKGLPMANQVIKDILFEKKVTKGVGQKISDFVDAGYGKDVRSIMGNNEEGGSPFVVDIHTARDMGLVDQTYLNKLKKLGYEIPEGIKIDISDGGINGTKYENRAMFGRELTDHLNAIEWQGKSDWKPAEIQAIGWMNLTEFTGELGTSGDVSMAMARNQRRISMEVAPGEGSPWEQEFSEDYSNLDLSSQEKINNEVTTKAIEMVNEVFGTNLSGVVHGTGGWELYQNPSSVEQMFSSKENARKAGAMLGYLLNQTEVWVNSAKEITKNPNHFGVDLVEDGTNNLRDSATLKKFFEFFAQNDANKLFRGYQPIETMEGNTGIRIIVDKDAISQAVKEKKIKKADVLPYMQDFLENKFPELTKDLDFSVQYFISEVELDKLRNDWSVDKNGENYQRYFSDETRAVTPTKSWSDIGNYLEKLTDLFGSRIKEAKETKERVVDKKREGGYVMSLPKIPSLVKGGLVDINYLTRPINNGR